MILSKILFSQYVDVYTGTVIDYTQTFPYGNTVLYEILIEAGNYIGHVVVVLTFVTQRKEKAFYVLFFTAINLLFFNILNLTFRHSRPYMEATVTFTYKQVYQYGTPPQELYFLNSYLVLFIFDYFRDNGGFFVKILEKAILVFLFIFLELAVGFSSFQQGQYHISQVAFGALGGIWAALASDTLFREHIEEDVRTLARGNNYLKGSDITKRFIYSTILFASAFGTLIAMYLYVFLRYPASILYYVFASKVALPASAALMSLNDFQGYNLQLGCIMGIAYGAYLGLIVQTLLFNGQAKFTFKDDYLSSFYKLVLISVVFMGPYIAAYVILVPMVTFDVYTIAIFKFGIPYLVGSFVVYMIFDELAYYFQLHEPVNQEYKVERKNNAQIFIFQY